jgi:hypothetical protein
MKRQRWLSAMPAVLARPAGGRARRRAHAAPRPTTQTSADNSADFGAVSVDVPPPPKRRVDIAKTTEWPDVHLESGTASISCSTDYATDGDGEPFDDLGFFTILDAMLPCKDAKGGAPALSRPHRGRRHHAHRTRRQHVPPHGIDERILDIDSSGGQVEDAIRAGDAMADSGWTIWVRQGAVCHSACVLLLAGGDDRVIAGAVGIHRIIRIQSDASRARS